MPSPQNVTELAKINQKRDRATSVVFAHYRGLKVNEMTELRGKIRDAGGELLVTKNTLLRIAFGDDTLSQTLVGPTTAIFAYGDEIAPLKVVADYHKHHELPTLTAGYVDGRALDQTAVVQLAKLPGKLELRAQVVRSLAAPLAGMVNVLQGNLRSLVYVLKAVHDKKN